MWHCIPYAAYGEPVDGDPADDDPAVSDPALRSVCTGIDGSSLARLPPLSAIRSAMGASSSNEGDGSTKDIDCWAFFDAGACMALVI